MLEGGGIITPPGPGVPAWNGLEAIFPALNAAAVIEMNKICTCMLHTTIAITRWLLREVLYTSDHRDIYIHVLSLIFLTRMDFSEQNRDDGFAVDVMRRPFQAKLTNDRMLIDNLPKWNKWHQYYVTLSHIEIHDNVFISHWFAW